MRKGSPTARENRAGLGSGSEFAHQAAARPSSSKVKRVRGLEATLAPFYAAQLSWYLCHSRRNPPAKRVASCTLPVQAYFVFPKYQSLSFLSGRWDKIPWEKEIDVKILNSNNTKPSTDLRSTKYSCWSTHRESASRDRRHRKTWFETHRGRLEREHVAVDVLWAVEVPCQQETSWRNCGKDTQKECGHSH